MNSFILELAAKYVKPLLLLFSVFVLLRGHNDPGGGFIAGLMAGSAFFLYAVAHGIEKGKDKIMIKPIVCLSIGFSLTLLSAIIGMMSGKPLLTGTWAEINLYFTHFKLGTPLLFDTGVYFIVSGVFITITFSILEELQWK